MSRQKREAARPQHLNLPDIDPTEDLGGTPAPQDINSILKRRQLREKLRRIENAHFPSDIGALAFFGGPHQVAAPPTFELIAEDEESLNDTLDLASY